MSLTVLSAVLNILKSLIIELEHILTRLIKLKVINKNALKRSVKVYTQRRPNI